MSIMDDEYVIRKHKIKRLFDTCLLVELLWENYCVSNQKYNNTTGDDVYNEVMKKEKYTKSEKEKIILDAMNILNIRYNVIIKDNIKKCIII